MAHYWLDAMVFISPSRQGYYDFDLAPSFWMMLEDRSADGVLASTTRVCGELARRRDAVGAWAEARKESRLFIEPNETVQDAFKKVADYVIGNYKHHRGAEFLGDADPWLIAHAIVDRGKVVTHEIPNSLMAQQVKIPNVCKAFNIECITLFEMFRELNIVLEFKG